MARCAVVLFLAASLAGCTPFTEFVRNGFKVGPNYATPPAPVAATWIDAADKRVRPETEDLSKWWTVFNDPALDALICLAYRQNLTLRQAGAQILAARAQRNIAIGNLFPQTQQATVTTRATRLPPKPPIARSSPRAFISRRTSAST